MRWVRRLIGVAIVVTIMVGGWRFAAENAAEITVHYLWGSRALRLWQALILAFGAGFALAGAAGLWFGVRARLVQRRYRKAVGGLESEIHQLRNLPLAPEGRPPDRTAPPAASAGRSG